MTEMRKNLLVSLLMLALVIAFLFATYGVSVKGQRVPQLVAWIGIVLCALDVIAHTGTAFGNRVALLLSGAPSAEEAAGKKPSLSGELIAMTWMVIATAGILLVGFLVATPVYVFGYMTLYGRKPIVQSGIAAVVTTLFIWVVFEVLMEYELYRGLLFDDL